VCYCYGGSTCGQRVFYQFRITQIPIFNVNNNCSIGSTGLYIARNTIGHGGADCILVVGFEKMMPGSLKSFWPNRRHPSEITTEITKVTRGFREAPRAAQLFGNAGREYMEK
jgi:sterol carrier protein 2